MSTDLFSTVENELPRDRWGRPLITPPTGGEPRAYTRVTTLAGSVEDTYHLGQWQQRMVAVGMARRPDLVLGALGADPTDKNGKKTSAVPNMLPCAEVKRCESLQIRTMSAYRETTQKPGMSSLAACHASGAS
jgi:hypothetical protein